MTKAINIGCGRDIIKGWDNLDLHKRNGANMIFDLNDIYKGKKLPFKDNRYEVVKCSHVLEDFVDPIPILDELCRIGKRIIINVPCDTSVHLGNINHKYSFTMHKLLNYAKEKQCYCDNANEIKVVSFKHQLAEMEPNALFCYIGRQIFRYKIVERTFLKYLFPIVNLEVIYEKII